MTDPTEATRCQALELAAKHEALHRQASTLFRELAALNTPADVTNGACFTAPLREFEIWWRLKGRYCQTGAGNHEKTFAYRAWEAREGEVTALQAQIAELKALLDQSPRAKG